MLSQEMAQRIEQWKLAALTPYPKNPRRHSDAQIAQIAGSIAQFGFNSPILIDAKGGMIAGHGRYLAALKLGLETAPVIISITSAKSKSAPICWLITSSLN
jgi:ParB-like chromosome segregation protein Spo0J